MTRLTIFPALLLMGLFAQLSPARAQDNTVPTFHCELRTPAGDTLGLTILVIDSGGESTLLIYSRDGSSWPGDAETALLATSERVGDKEQQFSLGNNRIRIERAGRVRNITIWSYDGGHVKQPLAFGFCSKEEIVSTAALTPIGSNPFDPARWKGDRCYLTQYNPEGAREFDFMMTHNSPKGEAFSVTFTGDTFANPVSVPREIMQNAPKAEHPDIFLGVGRFASADKGTGPRGMDVGYYDESTKLMSTIVRFSTVSGSDGPAYAICSASIHTVENSK